MIQMIEVLEVAMTARGGGGGHNKQEDDADARYLTSIMHKCSIEALRAVREQVSALDMDATVSLGRASIRLGYNRDLDHLKVSRCTVAQSRRGILVFLGSPYGV